MDVGANHSICLDDNDNIFVFGMNDDGELGLGKTDYNPHQKPIKMTFFQQRKIKIIQIKCGSYHSIVLSNQNRIYAWGYNENGQCGLGIKSKDPITTPTEISSLNNKNITTILCGGYHNTA
eukprot:221252_1